MRSVNYENRFPQTTLQTNIADKSTKLGNMGFSGEYLRADSFL